MKIGGTGALRGNHRRAERGVGRALGPEGGTFLRLLESLQNLTADANGRLDDLDRRLGKALGGVEGGIDRSQPKATLRNDANAAPFSIGDFKHFLQQRAGPRVSLAAD